MKRMCPQCERIIKYKNKTSHTKALQDNKPCISCCQKGKVAWNVGKTKESDERVARYSESLKVTWQGNKSTRVPWNKGLTISDPRVARNTKRSAKTLSKRYKSGEIQPWNKGKTHPKVSGMNSSNKRPEVRRKLREAALRRIEQNHGQVVPAYNPKACRLFDEINSVLGWNGVHAENGGEFRVAGYYLDYYNHVQNVVIEFDEPRHQRLKEKERDKFRQQEIVAELKCKFYRIRLGEEDKWKQILSEFL